MNNKATHNYQTNEDDMPTSYTVDPMEMFTPHRTWAQLSIFDAVNRINAAGLGENVSLKIVATTVLPSGTSIDREFYGGITCDDVDTLISNYKLAKHYDGMQWNRTDIPERSDGASMPINRIAKPY